MSQISLVENAISKEMVESIDKELKEKKIDYFSFELDENPNNGEKQFYYITKDLLALSKDKFKDIVNDLTLINNSILKKVVFHILNNDTTALSKMKFSREVISVLEYTFEKLKRENSELNETNIPLTYFGRFDLLVDENEDLKLVEINSETPAGMPESFSIEENITPKLNQPELIDVNKDIDYRLYQSLETKINHINTLELNDKNILVVYGDELNLDEFKSLEEYKNSENPEDYVNALHLTEFLVRQIPSANVNIAIANNIEIKKDGVYYKGEKQNYIWSFYPLEWYFTDEGADDFWGAYKNGEFELLNNPLNLITQNKAVWAYIWDLVDTDSPVLTIEEKEVIKKIVPKYYFDDETINLKDKNVLSKPLLYREGVGIGEDNILVDRVFQEKVKQKEFNVNCFYDGITKGYLTLGFYFGENGYIGTYNRFCDNEITDLWSQTIPLYLKD